MCLCRWERFTTQIPTILKLPSPNQYKTFIKSPLMTLYRLKKLIMIFQKMYLFIKFSIYLHFRRTCPSQLAKLSFLNLNEIVHPASNAKDSKDNLLQHTCE